MAVLLTSAAVALLGMALQHQQRAASVARGTALYTGDAALPGGLVGHDLTLPTNATRCANCHEAAAREAVAASGTRYAPVLNAQTLSTLQVRRGGPASRFDARTFCTLLRTGIDPAQVMIDVNMPRYTVTDSQCQDLWTTLQTR